MCLDQEGYNQREHRASAGQEAKGLLLLSFPDTLAMSCVHCPPNHRAAVSTLLSQGLSWGGAVQSTSLQELQSEVHGLVLAKEAGMYRLKAEKKGRVKGCIQSVSYKISLFLSALNFRRDSSIW